MAGFEHSLTGDADRFITYLDQAILSGSVTAQVGRAFGMKVTCWGRDASKAKAKELGYEVPASREAFFSGADVLCLHIPLNKETRGIVTAADLAQMKPSALLPRSR